MDTPTYGKIYGKSRVQDESGYFSPGQFSTPESETQKSSNTSLSDVPKGPLKYGEKQENLVAPDSNELTSEPSLGHPSVAAVEGTNGATFTIGEPNYREEMTAAGEEVMISKEEIIASRPLQVVGAVTNEPSKRTLAEKCMDLEKELETTTAQKDKAILELAESRTKYNAEITSKNAVIEKLEKDVEHYKSLLSDSEQASNAVKVEYEAKINNLKDELKGKEAEHEKEIAELEKQIALNKLEISQMETKEAKLCCQLAEARIDAANAETKAANAETNAANAETKAANAMAALAEEKLRIAEETRRVEEGKRKVVEKRLKTAENELRKSRSDVEQLVRRMSSTASITDTPYDSQGSCGD